MKSITKSVVVDQCGEVKIVGQNGKTRQPALMAALCQHPEVYGTEGTLTFTPKIINKALPWYRKDSYGYPIELFKGRRFANAVRIVLQNIRKLF